MKFAFCIFKYHSHGGLQLDMMRMAHEAVKRGHKVVIFAGEWRGDLPDVKHIEVSLVPLRSFSNHGRAAEYQHKVLALIAHGNFDLSVAFNRIGGCDLYFAADNSVAEQWSKKHCELLLKILPRYRIFMRLEKAVFSPESNSKIMYITPGQKESYMRYYGTAANRFELLPPGIDEKFRNTCNLAALRTQKRAELRLAPDEFMLILIGASHLGKGRDLAVAAVAGLPEAKRRQCKLYLVGGPVNCEALQLAEKLKITNQVISLGDSDEIQSLLAAADLMIHPARNEATGTVLLEAMACGVPILCSDCCGFKNYVLESGNLVWPMNDDPQGLSAMLNCALEHLPELRSTTIKYAETSDFYQRAAKAVDLMENLCSGK